MTLSRPMARLPQVCCCIPMCRWYSRMSPIGEDPLVEGGQGEEGGTGVPANSAAAWWDTTMQQQAANCPYGPTMSEWETGLRLLREEDVPAKLKNVWERLQKAKNGKKRIW